MLKLRKNKKGFTLVELIVVIAIMAVLAGVVAGVTVSQLNKQTDKTGKTQARQIADFIANYALTEDTMDDKTGNNKILNDGKFVPDNVKGLINKQYSATSIPVQTSGDAGAGEIMVTAEDAQVTITYNPKTNDGGVTYKVTPDGIVTRVAGNP